MYCYSEHPWAICHKKKKKNLDSYGWNSCLSHASPLLLVLFFLSFSFCSALQTAFPMCPHQPASCWCVQWEALVEIWGVADWEEKDLEKLACLFPVCPGWRLRPWLYLPFMSNPCQTSPSLFWEAILPWALSLPFLLFRLWGLQLPVLAKFWVAHHLLRSYNNTCVTVLHSKFFLFWVKFISPRHSDYPS